MLDKYIQLKENKIVCGQTSSGVWYCKEVPAESTKELKILIGEINKILNEYNKKENTPRTPKEKKPTVKGLE